MQGRVQRGYTLQPVSLQGRIVIIFEMGYFWLISLYLVCVGVAVDTSMELSTKVKDKAEKSRKEAVDKAEQERAKDPGGIGTLEVMFEGTGLKGGLDIFQVREGRRRMVGGL